MSLYMPDINFSKIKFQGMKKLANPIPMQIKIRTEWVKFTLSYSKLLVVASMVRRLKMPIRKGVPSSRSINSEFSLGPPY